MASNTITIICAVAAEFKRGLDKFYVTCNQLGSVLQAPDWIKDTLMFKLLASDGTLKYVTPANKIQMENEPLLGLNAEGKSELPVEEKKPVAEKEEEKPVVEAEAVEEKPVEAEATPAPKRTRSKKTEG